MKPIKTQRKLQLNREALRQLAPRTLSRADLARAVGGGDDEAGGSWFHCCGCCMTSDV